jgi:hypothetical protein
MQPSSAQLFAENAELKAENALRSCVEEGRKDNYLVRI